MNTTLSERSKMYKAEFILLCSFFTGFLWRLRGDHGWGGFAGMTAVALGLILVLISFYPYRYKFSGELFPLVIFMTAITNSGYGTLNSQITGILQSGTDAPSVLISPLSGAAAMFLVGFGWAPFLAMFIGYYLSDKKPKFYHYLIVIAVYYAVEYVTKASLSHIAVKAISPESVSVFADTLRQQGSDLTSYGAYLKHFNNISWAKKLDFGRNYFQLVETCSQAFAALATALYIRFAAKDKTGAIIQLLVCSSIGISITAADLFIFFADGGFRNSLTNVPDWLTGWSNWEYWTGFLTGLFIAMITVTYVSRHPSDEKMLPPSVLPEKKPLIFIKNLVMLGLPVIVSTAVPLAQRITYKNDFLFSKVNLPDDDILVIIFAVTAGLILILPAIRLTKNELAGDTELIFKAAPVWLTATFGGFVILYMFSGNAYFLNGSKTDISITMYISTAVIAVLLYLLNRQKKHKIMGAFTKG